MLDVVNMVISFVTAVCASQYTGTNEAKGKVKNVLLLN